MFCISVVSVVIFPFSSWILVIWVFPLLHFISVARGLSILFTFSKNQLFVLSIFWIVSLVSILLISALILIISCLLLFLVLISSSFSRVWDVMLGHLVVDFLFFLMYEPNAMNFPLSILSECPRDFDMSCCTHLPLRNFLFLP